MTNDFEDSFDDVIDFKKLITTLQMWVWLLVLLTVIGASAAYFYSRQQTPVYEATTNVLVTRNSQQSVGDISQSLNLSTSFILWKTAVTMCPSM